MPFISNIIEKIKEKRHGAKLLKPTKKTPAEEKSAEEKTKNYDAEKAKNELEIFLKEGFKGSENAKDQIRRFFTTYSAEREATLTESELPSPRVLVFNGPSGTGKLFVAKTLAQLMSDTDVKPYTTTAIDIKRWCAKHNYMGYADAFMYGTIYPSEGNLFNYLQKNERKVKVVVLDEWDKLYEKQDGKYPEKHPLDEMFRDIRDGTLRNWYGNNVDFSGTIFICTTNETKASLQGHIKLNEYGELVEAKLDKDGNYIYDEDGQPIYGDLTMERGKSIVPHDRSLLARMAGSIYYFDKN